MFTTAKQLMLAMNIALDCDYIQVGVAGDEVPHFHIHLIPRFSGTKIFGEHRPQEKYESGEMQSIAQKIIKEI